VGAKAWGVKMGYEEDMEETPSVKEILDEYKKKAKNDTKRKSNGII